MTKLRTIIAAVAISYATVTRAAPTSSIYRAQTWGDAISEAPCDAFRRNKDGSWTQIYPIILGDGRGLFKDDGFFNSKYAINLDATNLTLEGNTFGNTEEAAILDQRCRHA